MTKGYNPPPPKLGYTGDAGATDREVTAPMQQGAHDEALTYDEGKLPLAQLPWAAIEALSRGQVYGAKKYKDFNNYRKGMRVMRNLSCALRHIVSYIRGEDIDPESGVPHLGLAMCRIGFVLQNIAENKQIDDRFKP